MASRAARASALVGSNMLGAAFSGFDLISSTRDARVSSGR